MRRTRLALLLALALSLIVGPGTARHLSVGVDNTGSLDGTPSQEPTVPQDAYRVGTSPDCHEPQGQVGVDPVVEALFANGFCGELRYHSNVPHFEVASPPDQDLRASEIDTFDVVPVQRVSGVATCVPMCPSHPGGESTWRTTHALGASLGQTDDASTASEQAPEDRKQTYGGHVHAPSATQLAQNDPATWRMNGWLTPSATRGFVAYLLDRGDPIGEGRLGAIVDVYRSNGALADDTRPVICGLTPDADFTSLEPANRCEIRFEYVEPRSDPTEQRHDGYHDECESPTYLCSPNAGGHWRSTKPCAGCAGLDPTQHTVWHWVLAPHPSECGGAQEPGVALKPDDGTIPYLAHDLDVYTPATALSHVPADPAQSSRAYAGSVVDRARDEAGPALEDAELGLPPLPAQLGDKTREQAFNAQRSARDALVEASYQVSKSHRVEPNAEPVQSLHDTSQHLAIERTSDCGRLHSDETPRTEDPWTNIVDAKAIATAGSGGAYQNSKEHQDEHNNPTAQTYRIEGKVGLFTDKNDDGDYDQVAAGQKYRGKHVAETGAYPMLWDLKIGPETQRIDPEGGCRLDGTPFSQAMQQAGYGPNTGLATLVYLSEPSTVRGTSPGDVVVHSSGNNVYLLGAQSVHERWEGPDQLDPYARADPALDNAVDRALRELIAFADETNGELEEPDVVQPGREFGYASDFQPQCGEPTGGFESKITLSHDCTLGCQGDTIATVYAFDTPQGSVGGGPIPSFEPNTDPYEFQGRVRVWTDVDPFDGDPDRNRHASSRPPTGE